MSGEWDALLEDAQSSIDRVGWHAVGVFATEEGQTVGFTYTVGLDPELLVIGLSPTRAHGVIHSAVVAADEEWKATPYETLVTSDVLAGMRVRFDGVPLEHRERLCTLAHAWREWRGDREPFEALQIVWPDPAGLLPGEDGCDDRYVQRQRLGAA